MGLPNRTRDFTSATWAEMMESLSGPTEESREFRDLWNNYGSCFENLDLWNEAVMIDEFISLNRYLMSDLAPREFQRVYERIHELDEAFGKDCENTVAEIQDFGTGIDLLTEAISGKGFPASFREVGSCLQVFFTVNSISSAGSSFLSDTERNFGSAKHTRKSLLTSMEEWIRGQLRDRFRLKDAEIDLCFQYPKDAYFVLKARVVAEHVEDIYFGDTVDSTQENAFLHAYWNALMVMYVGSEKAELFANAHEVQNKGVTLTPQLLADTAMDLHNNPIGRNIGLQVSKLSVDESNAWLSDYFDKFGETQAALDEYGITHQELLAMMLVNDKYLDAVQCVYENEQLSSLNGIDFENRLVFLN